jgi:hypothetical protein
MLRDQYKIHQTKKDLANQLAILKFYCKFFGFAYGRSFNQACYPYDGEMFRKGETNPAELIAVKDRPNLELHEAPLGLSVHLSDGSGIYRTNFFSVDCHPMNVLVENANQKNITPVLVARFMKAEVGCLVLNTECLAVARTQIKKHRCRDERADRQYLFSICDFKLMRLST